MPASEPTRLLSDGDNIDLGDRIFEVVHLPGVTDGASGLFERASGLLFLAKLLYGQTNTFMRVNPQIAAKMPI
jgi:glyoxylase-like metal-dependent hydrolase (beta-lactamase superfamily II)